MFALKMAKNKCTAKRKCENEHRIFLTEWESLYFFVERNGVATNQLARAKDSCDKRRRCASMRENAYYDLYARSLFEHSLLKVHC